MHVGRRWLWSLALVWPLWVGAQGTTSATAAPAPSAALTPERSSTSIAASDLVNHGWSVKVEDGNSISRLVAPLVQAPNGVSLEQAMMATYLANPHAFVDGNASRLVVGATVSIARLSDARKISKAEARDWWKAQKEWFYPKAAGVLESSENSEQLTSPAPEPVAQTDETVAPAAAQDNAQPTPPPTTLPAQFSLLAWISTWSLWVWALIGLIVMLVLGISLITPDRAWVSSEAHRPKRAPVAPAGQPTAMIIDDELPPLDEDDDAPMSHPPKRALPSISLDLGGRS